MTHKLLTLLPLLMLTVWSANARDWPTKIQPEAERGRELYDRHCQGCHGPKAAGDGLMVASLQAKVPDLSAGYEGKVVDDYVRVVLHGRGLMPAFEASMSKDDAEKLVRFMGSIGKEPAKSEKPAKDDKAGDDGEEEVGGG